MPELYLGHMGVSQELVDNLSSGVSISKEALGAFTGGVFALTSLVKSLKRVQQGEMGIRTRFGKVKLKDNAPVIVGPGLHWVMPFTHSIEPVDVRDQSTDLGEMMIDREEQYRVMSSMIWRVSPEGDNPFRARYGTQTLLETVTNIGSGSLRTVMMDIRKEQMMDAEAIQAEVSGLCSDPLLEYGVEFRGLNVHSIARSIGEMIRSVPDPQSPNHGALSVVTDAISGRATG